MLKTGGGIARIAIFNARVQDNEVCWLGNTFKAFETLKVWATRFTTVCYLYGKLEDSDTFKDPAMLKRLQDIIKTLPERIKNIYSILTIDGLLRDAKSRLAYSDWN